MKRAAADDGTQGVIIPYAAISKRYWARYSRAWVMEFYIDGRASNLPDSVVHATTAGGHGPDRPAGKWAWVPLTYAEPEVNEWGECAP